MKFYKIVNPEGHHGLVYHEGLNTDPLPFNPSGDCEDGGIYFSREDIFYFLSYGTELYEVEPVGEVYENPSNPQKWKAHEVILKHIGKLCDLNNIKMLVEQGADIHNNHDLPLQAAASYGHLTLVKYLIENGATVRACDELALRWAANNGHLDVVKYLVTNGADIHARDDYASPLFKSNEIIHILKDAEGFKFSLNNFKVIHIKYVHQLQNLIYDIEDEELEFKGCF